MSACFKVYDFGLIADTFSEKIFDTRCARAYFLGAASVTIFTNFFGSLLKSLRQDLQQK